MEVTPVKVLHYELEAYGFRISANGSVLAYSGDSGPNGGLAELARDADLFVCEATLADGDEEREGRPRGHLSAREAEASLLLQARSGFCSPTARSSARSTSASSRRTTGSSWRSRPSEDRGLAPDAPHFAPDVAHLAHRHVRAGSVEDERASGSRRLARDAAFNAASADSTAAESRLPRSACTRAICCGSRAGSIFRISSGCSSSSWYRLTPTMIRCFASTSAW